MCILTSLQGDHQGNTGTCSIQFLELNIGTGYTDATFMMNYILALS